MESVIFNGSLPFGESVTSWFTDGDFIQLEKTSSDGEFEIEAFLNVETSPGVIRVYPLESNLLDTEKLFIIPAMLNRNLRKRLILLNTIEVTIRITVLTFLNTCELLRPDLEELKLYGRYSSLSITQTNLALNAFALGIAGALPTGGASLIALPTVIAPILTPIPLLLP